MGDLWEFIKSVFGYWIYLMTGIGSLLVTLMERVRKSPVTMGIFYVISAMCIITAFFFAWRDERNRFKTEIRANISQITLHPDFEDKNSTGIFLVVSIRNVGDPTSLADWKLEVKFTDGTISEGLLMVIPSTVTLQGDIGIQKYYGRDALYNLTLAPIAKGVLLRGVLWFNIPNIKPEAFLLGTQFKLKFKDVLEREYFATMTISSKAGELLYYPGLSID